MRARKSFDPKMSQQAKEVLRGLNEIKNGLVSSNRAFTLETLCKSLKEIGLPTNATFKTALINCELPVQKCKLLTQVSKGNYVFTKPKDPIHWIDLQAIYNLFGDLCRKYKKTIKEAPIKEESEETLEDVINEIQAEHKDREEFERLLNELKETPKQKEESDIQKAINLLKANGYQVLKPTAVVYTIV